MNENDNLNPKALMRRQDYRKALDLKAKICYDEKKDLSRESFIELIEKRVEDCEAWERKLRAQGNLKDAERMRKTKDQMLKSLRGLKCPSPKKR